MGTKNNDKKIKINVFDLSTLLSWLYYNNFIIKTTEKFKYNSIVKLINTESNDIEISVKVLSSILNDSYYIYEKLDDKYFNNLKEVVNDKTYKILTKTTYNFKKLYEKLIMLNDIKIIKGKSLLNNIMDFNIKLENYEYCSKIRDKLKEYN